MQRRFVRTPLRWKEGSIVEKQQERFKDVHDLVEDRPKETGIKFIFAYVGCRCGGRGFEGYDRTHKVYLPCRCIMISTLNLEWFLL